MEGTIEIYCSWRQAKNLDPNIPQTLRLDLNFVARTNFMLSSSVRHFVGCTLSCWMSRKLISLYFFLHDRVGEEGKGTLHRHIKLCWREATATLHWRGIKSRTVKELSHLVAISSKALCLYNSQAILLWSRLVCIWFAKGSHFLKSSFLKR